MSKSKIFGYRRADGTLGIRNHIAVIPSVDCANEVAKRIANQVEHAVALPHTTGCGTYGDDIEKTFQTLVGLGAHPNVAGVLIVSLGCESIDVDRLILSILRRRKGKMIEKIIIQEEHGTSNTISKGVMIASTMARKASMLEKSEGYIKDIIFATECGGSDPTSGLAANPAVGYVVEKIIAMGGSAMLCETREIIGAEHILAENAVNNEVANDLLDVVHEVESKC